MAEPGDPERPEKPLSEVDHDDAVGFVSASSLRGQSRGPVTPEAEQPVEHDPAGFELDPEPDPFPASDRPLEPLQAFDRAPVADAPSAAALPAWAIETPTTDPVPPPRFGRRHEAPVEVEGAMALYSVYVLILFAVPTLGVAALVALFAVSTRPIPAGDIVASHFLFQKRTLWIGAVAALVGVVLTILSVGVFVLFILAVWLILRAAAGVMRLKAGRPIADPNAWLL